MPMSSAPMNMSCAGVRRGTYAGSEGGAGDTCYAAVYHAKQGGRSDFNSKDSREVAREDESQDRGSFFRLLFCPPSSTLSLSSLPSLSPSLLQSPSSAFLSLSSQDLSSPFLTSLPFPTLPSLSPSFPPFVSLARIHTAQITHERSSYRRRREHRRKQEMTTIKRS